MDSLEDRKFAIQVAQHFASVRDGNTLDTIVDKIQHFLVSGLPEEVDLYEEDSPPAPEAIALLLVFFANEQSTEGYSLLRLILERFVEISTRPSNGLEQKLRAYQHIFLLQPLASQSDFLAALLDPSSCPELYHGAMAMFKATAPDDLVARLEATTLLPCSKEWARPLPADFFEVNEKGEKHGICRMCKRGGVNNQGAAMVQARKDWVEQWKEEGGVLPSRGRPNKRMWKEVRDLLEDQESS